MKIFALLTLIIAFSSCRNEIREYVISGQVTDFNGTPLDSVTIRLKNKTFENVYETISDRNGNYSMKVKKGEYYCLYAIKIPDYRVTKLEYWTWNVPVYKNLTINPVYDKMEIYGINVFEPQVTPHQTYMIYFRPMSLNKTLKVAQSQKVESKSFQTANKTESLLASTSQLINVSPDSISPKELTVEINGNKATIVGINKVKEYARGIYMYGYIVQVLKPESEKLSDLEYDKISITLHSEETNEMGKGEAFVKRIKSEGYLADQESK